MPEIEIVVGGLDRPYRVIGPITARVTSKAAFLPSRKTEEVDSKLRQEAWKRGANAVINVRYERGISITSWKALTARGLAVLASASVRTCPFCAEQVRREAAVCRFCGRDLPELRPEQDAPAASQAAWGADPTRRHELRYWDGQQWTEHVSDAGGQAVYPVWHRD
jgi:hypothetical protein